MRLLPTLVTHPDLSLEARSLFDRVIELAERVGQLASRHEDLEPFRYVAVSIAPALRQGAELDGIVVHNQRAAQMFLHQLLEYAVQ